MNLNSDWSPPVCFTVIKFVFYFYFILKQAVEFYLNFFKSMNHINMHTSLEICQKAKYLRKLRSPSPLSAIGH